MTPPALPPPVPEDVIQAALRLQGPAHRTPVLRSGTADRLLHAHLFFKCENLQRAGSFKFRGAFNTLSQFTPEQRRHGVLAFSAGNHAQAIALAARLLDMPALIVMPEDAPASKMAATREYGAQVVTYNRYTEDREAISQRIAQERGMTLVGPSEHPHVIAGQGTAALELFEEVPRLDYLFVGVGGGGLMAGSLLAAQARAPQCQVVGVEPEAANDAQQSLRSGHIVRIATPRTIADGAQAQSLGPLVFDIVRRQGHDITTTSDLHLMQAMRFFAERMKIVVEPTGALAFAGAQHGGVDIRGKRVGIVISGGNVDLARYARFLAD
ncbi:MAG: threo-3-hydroxy-L-aspartate ammonia-lyase [Simplicispira sp.]|uniref:threo-3-hydroxy-L-aspartate ammonia-lyase n=1 Tax=Simplicispira sp. TaxID=2015802 RepID=UPI0000DCCD8A|nr:threo-3-hydroxy-L-aspartate ammonia-lyase [Simplicispira sp.]ABM42074.1 Pyridoxal-5'-phosphate-dependent enzyme, beta subunit [Acidovorax sp. JS42]MBP7414992.1 threo-3-hydroxy-L-aspartate ammonia-lyase [Giesbergeria sp.]MDD2692419.1 threo-3-hydroxy-L-aspartate ammonia-lyase [Simplicispira sp.]